MIELKNICIAYTKEFYTLMNVNANLDTNSLIIGNKNDGTHSLMRIIAKIDKDYTGNVTIDEKNLREINDKDLDIAYIPSETYLFEHKSIFDNIYYPLKIRKIKKKDAYPTINEIMDKYLSKFPDKIKNMNNSQKKIIALIRAMIRKPKFVLIENLFTNLDSEYINLAYELINEISKHSIIIACEPQNVECYANFKMFTLSYGSLN